MKEAAGEANMTVITIVLIGVVAAVGMMLIPNLLGNIQKKSCCTDNGGKWSAGGCVAVSGIDYNSAGYSSCVNAK